MYVFISTAEAEQSALEQGKRRRRGNETSDRGAGSRSTQVCKNAHEAKHLGSHGVDWYSKRDHATTLSKNLKTKQGNLTPSGMGGLPPQKGSGGWQRFILLQRGWGWALAMSTATSWCTVTPTPVPTALRLSRESNDRDGRRRHDTRDRHPCRCTDSSWHRDVREIGVDRRWGWALSASGAPPLTNHAHTQRRTRGRCRYRLCKRQGAYILEQPTASVYIEGVDRRRG